MTEPRVSWRCTECHNKVDPVVMKLGRCPICLTWHRWKPSPSQMFRSYGASAEQDVHGEEPKR